MEAIIKEIERLEDRITWEREDLEKAIDRFRDAASKYDAISIETFIPKIVEEIATCRARMEMLLDQKDLLEYLLKQEE